MFLFYYDMIEGSYLEKGRACIPVGLKPLNELNMLIISLET